MKTIVRRPTSVGLSVVIATVASFASPAARAEGRLRIAEQFGIVYLMLQVATDQKLIEKHAKADGIDVKVELIQLSGGAAINEALLSGSVDVGGAGTGPMLTLWDRTSGHQNVRAIASLGNLPYQLLSSDPAVLSVKDFTDRDRIATPAVGVSMQSRMLQMATAKAFDEKQFNRFDKLQVALPHPEATAALLKGSSDVTAHFSSPPFQEQELAGNRRVHVVTSSYDVLGGPASAALIYTTEKYRRDNPKTYRAFVEGLADAAALIHADPERAADIFIRVNHSGIDRALLLTIIRSKDIDYKLTPDHTLPLAEFMYRVGAIKHKPASARDYVFDDPHNAKAN